MRILTLRPPWGWAVIYLFKDIENRTRNLAGDYRGPVAIHQGHNPDDRADVIWPVGMDIPTEAWVPRGVILGVATIDGVHPTYADRRRLDLGHGQSLQQLVHCSRWAQYPRNGTLWHHHFTDPQRLAEPIPYTGGLGLRTLPDDVTELVNAGLIGGRG